MKRTTNLFLFFIMFTMSIVFLMLPASAIVYSGFWDDPRGLGAYDNENMLVVDHGTTYDMIGVFSHTGSGSEQHVIDGLPATWDATIGTDGLIYFVLNDGRVFQHTNKYTDNFTTEFDGNFLLLGTLDTGYHEIVADNANNIYVTSGDNVYVFGGSQFNQALYTTIPTQQEGGYDNAYSLAMHQDGLIIGSYGVTDSIPGTFNIYLYNGTLNVIHTVNSGSHGENDINIITDVYSVENGDIYYTVALNDGTSCSLNRLNYSDSWSSSTITSLLYKSTGMHIDSIGSIYIAETTTDAISSYGTVGDYGGYFIVSYEGSTGAKQLDYDVSTLTSLYAAYNNDSNVELAYSIDIDLVQGITPQDFYDSDSNSQFYWIVDLIDTNGIKQKSSIINTFDKDYSIVSGWHIISTGTLTYSSNAWENGTWSAILYEYDINTGLRAELDDCAYEVHESKSDTTISDDTPNIDPSLDPVSRIDELLKSNAFVGLLIMIACIGAFGKIGGVTGVVLGTVAGVSLSYLLGYIPAWVLFLMVLALCVVFVSKLINGFGGNSS